MMKTKTKILFGVVLLASLALTAEAALNVGDNITQPQLDAVNISSVNLHATLRSITFDRGLALFHMRYIYLRPIENTTKYSIIWSEYIIRLPMKNFYICRATHSRGACITRVRSFVVSQGKQSLKATRDRLRGMQTQVPESFTLADLGVDDGDI